MRRDQRNGVGMAPALKRSRSGGADSEFTPVERRQQPSTAFPSMPLWWGSDVQQALSASCSLENLPLELRQVIAAGLLDPCTRLRSQLLVAKRLDFGVDLGAHSGALGVLREQGPGIADSWCVSRLYRLQEHACRAGIFDLVRWTYERGCAISHISWCEAAAKGQLVLLCSLVRSGHIPPHASVDECAAAAAAGGHCGVLGWLMGLGLIRELNSNRCATAASRGGHVTVLEWLKQHGSKAHLLADCGYEAAVSGNLGTLKWLAQHGCHLNQHTCRQAAAAGHLDVLQWLRGVHCPWNSETCLAAAEAGHLKVLKWARDHGCPWDERACCYAAWGGHLDILQWALEIGCTWPWSELILNAAAVGGHHQVLHWLKQVKQAKALESFQNDR